MASMSPVVAETLSSLDISADSNEKDNGIQVWTTQNNEQNGGQRFSDISSTEAQKSSFNVPSKFSANGATKDDESNRSKNGGLELQQTDVKLTLVQKMSSWRFFMVLLLQSSLVVSMFMRHCLPMTLVCMVRPRAATSASSLFANVSSNNSDYTGQVGFGRQESDSVSSSHNNTYRKGTTSYEFDWSSDLEGLLLTSAMFTGFTGPLLIGIVREHVGTKRTMSLTHLLSTLLTFLSPMGARISPYCLVAIRMCLGITLGGNIPVIGDCVAWWAPQDEKLTMISLTYTGLRVTIFSIYGLIQSMGSTTFKTTQSDIKETIDTFYWQDYILKPVAKRGANIGIVLSSFLSGYLCLVPIDNGWPFVFYTFGTISLLWGVCWHFLSSHKPEDHPYLSEKEKQYIISHREGMDAPAGGKNVKPPYRKVLTSVPVLAYIACTSASMWAFQVFFSYLPSFFNKRLKFAIQETGMLTSMTSSCRMVGVFFWTALGNKLTSTVGSNKARKICIGIGFFLAGLSTIAIGFFDESYKWVVLGLLTFVMINQSVRSSALVAIPLDMAPRYAGLISGMTSSIGGFVAISGPLLTAAITPNGTLDEWRKVWFIMGSVFIIGSSIFLLFGKVSLQPWAQGKNAEAPHIITPFVTMGRRFSLLMESPPLTILAPMKREYEISINIQSSAETVSPEDVSYTPEAVNARNMDLENCSVPEAIVKTSIEVENLYDKGYDNTINTACDSKENVQKHNNMRKGAYSDYELSIIKSGLIHEVIEPGREENTLIEQSNGRDEHSVGFSKTCLGQNYFPGNVNEAYVDLEDDTKAVQIWRL